MFNVLSDIHLEKTPDRHVIRRINSIIPNHRARFLLLAGDIGDPFSPSFWRYIETQSFLYEKVFFVTGNKEYNLTNDIKNEILIVHHHIHEQLERKNLKNVHFLDERSMELEDFVIIGTTLWTYIPKNISNYKNDEAICSLFQSNVKFLENEIQKAYQNNPKKPIIVLTHFAPTKKNTSMGLKEDYFHSVDLEAYVPSFNLVNTYVYGHTHLNPPYVKKKYQVKNTVPIKCLPLEKKKHDGNNVWMDKHIRYVSNQVGYHTTKVLEGCHIDFSFLL